MNYPVFAFTRAHFDRSTCKIEGHAAAQITVVQEVTLDFFALITQSDEELVQTIMRVMLHDVPENGTSSYFHHRLGPNFSLFGQARTDTACQDCYFHA